MAAIYRSNPLKSALLGLARPRKVQQWKRYVRKPYCTALQGLSGLLQAEIVYYAMAMQWQWATAMARHSSRPLHAVALPDPGNGNAI
jgi:hypothetical protein